ncbi:hypothetical protein [Streptomyces sp. NPDC059783]|uniref:hypothetical protein n=1 Tax=Streptomyces sp. NPDC059783 TaxID=3346944 RepID=UPI00365AA0D0
MQASASARPCIRIRSAPGSWGWFPEVPAGVVAEGLAFGPAAARQGAGATRTRGATP